MILGLVMATLVVASPGEGPAPQEPTARVHRQKLVVMATEDSSGRNAKTADLISQVLVSEASQRPIAVVGSEEVKQVLGLERQRQLLGCKEESSCTVEIAGAMGADKVLTSRIGQLGDKLRIDLRLVDSHKAQILASVGAFMPNDGNQVADLVPQMANDLLDKGGIPRPAVPDATLMKPVAVEPVGPSHIPAYLSFAGAGVLAVVSAVLTLQTKSAYDKLSTSSSAGAVSNEETLAHLADGFAAGAVVVAGVGVWLYVSPPGGGSGGGSDVGVGLGGRF